MSANHEGDPSDVDDSLLFTHLDTTQDALLDDADDPVDPSFMELTEDENAVLDPSPDLYAVLGVSKTASLADIRGAYKRLSLLFHPDRHATGDSTGITDISHRQAADAAFNRVSTAYAILSDPNKRAIYDNYGYAGLKIQGWEIASCEKSAAELRLEYLMLKQKAEAEKQLQLTQPTSEFAVGLDFTDLFDNYLQQPVEDRVSFPWPSVNQLYLAQSVTAGLSLADSLSLAGQVTARNGLGVGTGMLMWRHYCGRRSVLSSTTIDAEVSYGRSGRGLDFGLRFKRPFGDRFVGSLGLSLTALLNHSTGPKISLIPGLSTGCTVQLLPRTQARIEWRGNLHPGLSAELAWVSVDDKYTARLSTRLSATGRAGLALRLERTVSWLWLNPPRGSGLFRSEQSRDNSAAPEWAKFDDQEPESVDNHEGRLFGSIDVNSQDLAEFCLGAQCSISVYSRVSGSLSFSLLRGVSAKFALHRGTQTYSLPVALSEEPNLIAAAYGLVVPVLLFTAVRSLIYEPYLNRHMERAQLVRRSKLKGELARRRREAMTTQSLMLASANRIKQAEAAIGGLVISRAIYGFLPSDPHAETRSDPGGPLSVDVTVPVQALVEQSRIRLPPGRWSDMQGFYDPCLGIQRPPAKAESLRQLRVMYLFHGAPHEVTVSEDEGLAIPMTKHRIEAV